MSMSISYEATGRTTQKARTRAALIDAARRLLAAGRTPSVEDAAEAAAVSRATAYRYFPNRRALLVAAHPEVEATDLLGQDAPQDAHERLDRTIAELIRLTVDTEPQLRTMLRLSLEPGPHHELPLRRAARSAGSRRRWPRCRHGSTGRAHRLVIAIRAACGIESLVWLTDVAGLSRREASELMRWSALALLRTALAEADERTGSR